jgi:hypothetical protein
MRIDPHHGPDTSMHPGGRDENGQKNIYPVFTFTFFSRTKMKIGMTETKMNGINPDRNILETVGNR